MESHLILICWLFLGSEWLFWWINHLPQTLTLYLLEDKYDVTLFDKEWTSWGRTPFLVLHYIKYLMNEAEDIYYFYHLMASLI